MQTLLLALVIFLPIAWLLAEFEGARWLRITLGVCCFGIGIPCAFLVGEIGQTFNDNAEYGGATAELIDVTIQHLNGRKCDQVLAELRRFREGYRPSYETSAKAYQREINEFKDRMRATSDLHKPGDH
jgi:hypothetical protein